MSIVALATTDWEACPWCYTADFGICCKGCWDVEAGCCWPEDDRMMCNCAGPVDELEYEAYWAARRGDSAT